MADFEWEKDHLAPPHEVHAPARDAEKFPNSILVVGGVDTSYQNVFKFAPSTKTWAPARSVSVAHHDFRTGVQSVAPKDGISYGKFLAESKI